MSQSSPHLLSARAIEDIIQLPKLNDKLTRVTESDIGTFDKEKLEEAGHTINKYHQSFPFPESQFGFPKVIEGNIKQNQIKVGKATGHGSEGDVWGTEITCAEELKLFDKTDSELELRSWPSDSDVTVVRMKKEYRNELSTKVSWEEDRGLTDKNSSMNFDWESHSLINLAKVTVKEKDDTERLTPFTIWSKTDYHNELVDTNVKSREGGNENSVIATKKSSDAYHCEPEKAESSEPVHLLKNKKDETFHNPRNELLPLLDEKINLLYRTEPFPSIQESAMKPKNISDLPQSGNKVPRSGKSKLIKTFISIFAKCGSRKPNSNNNN